jgi:hypothetical protein
MKELKDIISDIDESVWRILSNDFNLLTNVILELTERTSRTYFMLAKFATIALEYICTC